MTSLSAAADYAVRSVRASYSSRAVMTSSMCSTDHSVSAFSGYRSVWPSAVSSYSTCGGTSG